MSEAAEEKKEEGGGKKKGGGKLPIILVLVIVLLGGGFFVMKGKGKKPKKPPVELGEIEPMTEYLVNLKGGVTYLRMEIGVQMKKGFEKKKFEEKMPALRDAVLMILTNKSLKDVSSNEGKVHLKREICFSLNKVLKEEEKEKKKDDEESSDESDGEKKDKDSKDGEKDKGKEKKEEKIPEGMDGSGPALKIYITNFATQ